MSYLANLAMLYYQIFFHILLTSDQRVITFFFKFLQLPCCLEKSCHVKLVQSRDLSISQQKEFKANVVAPSY